MRARRPRTVRQMMGAPGALGRGLPLNAEQKKKLLWGGKQAAPAVAVGGPDPNPF